MCYFCIQDYQGAHSDYSTAIELDPNDPGLLDNLGYLYLEIEKYDNAVENFIRFIKTVENNPVRIDALLGHAIACYYKKDKINAGKYIQMARSENLF
jgi:tetratricopeptide (TPR) repeat protein